MSTSEGRLPEPYEQVVQLSGRNALRTGTLGLLVLAMGAVVVWLTSPEPWPIRVGASLVWIPVLMLGTFILAMAALFHARRAIWRLSMDTDFVTLDMRTADGRSMKHEAVRIDELDTLAWVEGDADVSAGVRLRTRSGKDLFVPADAFDVAVFWDYARRRLPDLPAEKR